MIIQDHCVILRLAHNDQSTKYYASSVRAEWQVQLSKLTSISEAPPPPGMDDREVWYGTSCDEEAILKGQTRFLPRACPHGADVCAGVIHV